MEIKRVKTKIAEYYVGMPLIDPEYAKEWNKMIRAKMNEEVYDGNLWDMNLDDVTSQVGRIFWAPEESKFEIYDADEEIVDILYSTEYDISVHQTRV